MKRITFLFLGIVLMLFVIALPLVAQETESPPPDEQSAKQDSAGDESATGQGAAGEEVVAIYEVPKPVFNPASVKIPVNIELRDLPNDKGDAAALCWDIEPNDFKPADAEFAPGESWVHILFLVNGSRVIEFEDVAKQAKPMSGSQQYWGVFEKDLDKRKWLLIEGFEPDTAVNVRIGVVPPELEIEYAEAKGKLAAIKTRMAELDEAKHSRALEQMRRKRQEKIDEYDARIEELQSAIDDIGYSVEEATAAWEAARNKVYYFPSEYTTQTETGWFHSLKTNNLVFGFLFGAVVLAFIAAARKDKNLFIRRINGLEAVDEAIGRATEMGKPILYLTGMTSLADLATLAAINILGEVAKKIAEYESALIVPCRDPVVMTVNQETVKAAYTEAGRPDRYNEDSVFFLTEDQFSYTASVNGIMLRDKPAANFFMGYYFAESLLLAETGAMTGAIQIAGTDSLAQLPFFITACDYTLIGEELYAASAYLSREPLLLGSLKGQDVGKLFLMAVILLGTLLVSLGAWLGIEGMDYMQKLLTAL